MPSPKKILFLTTQFYRGGAETSLLNLFHQLPPEEYTVDFFVMNQLKLERVTSLVEEVPEYINVYSPAEKLPNIINIGLEVLFRLFRKITGKTLKPKGMQPILKKEYDIAISYGEWVDTEIVAKYVNAKRKAVWIHTDIDKSHFFDDTSFFKWDKEYSDYLFVSQNSMKGAVERWPFIQGKARVVHNTLDEKLIQSQATMPLPAQWEAYFDFPVLLSVGNLRKEKNYPRQIEAMALAKKAGCTFKWLVVGSDVNITLNQQLKSQLKQLGLEDDFVFLGADSNPYKYMAKSQGVCVFGDYESWSLVISEALLLNRPVLATKTSGALEQIKDEKNGLLADFTAENIAEIICRYFNDKELQKKLAEGAASHPLPSGPQEFKAFAHQI